MTARKGKQRTTSKLLRANSIFGEYEMLSTQSKYIFGLATIGSSAVVLKIKARAVESVLKSTIENPTVSAVVSNGLTSG